MMMKELSPDLDYCINSFDNIEIYEKEITLDGCSYQHRFIIPTNIFNRLNFNGTKLKQHGENHTEFHHFLGCYYKNKYFIKSEIQKVGNPSISIFTYALSKTDDQEITTIYLTIEEFAKLLTIKYQ